MCLDWFMVPRVLFQMVLNFSDFQGIFANFSAILVFGLTSLQTHRKAKPQSRLLWHFTVVLLVTLFWSQRFCDPKDKRFRVIILHSVSSCENPQGACSWPFIQPWWASLDINPRLSSSHLKLDEICQLVVNRSLHHEPSAQHWEMKVGIANCNSRARKEQTEQSYMNIMIPELCYLLGASISISGYYSVLAGWHLWFSGFRLGFSVHLNQMSANKHLLCFKFPKAFLSNLLFSLNQMLSSAEPENENKLQMVSTGYFVGKKCLWKDKKKPWLG